MNKPISKLKNLPMLGKTLVLVSTLALIKFYTKEVVNLYVMAVYLCMAVMAYRFASQFNFKKKVEQSK